MLDRANRRHFDLLGGVLAMAILALPSGVRAQEPDEPGPAAQIEDPQLRGLHAQMLGLHERMQDLRAQMAARRQQLLGDEAADPPPHQGRHAMHLRGLGEGRDMGMGMQGMQGRGMMMGRGMSGQEGTEGGMRMRRRMSGQEETEGAIQGRRMMRGGATAESGPRWWPAGMQRRMMRGMMRQGAAGPEEPEGEGGGG